MKSLGGEVDWRELLKEFYGPFIDLIGRVEKEAARVKVPEEITDIACENCGAPMAVKHGRFGSFLGCTKFPECRTTKPIVKDAGVACPLCEKPVVERKTKTGRLFFGCSDYPTCKFISWNKPLNESCPVCGSFMVEKKYKNQPAKHECGNVDCPTRAGTSKEELEKAPAKTQNVKSASPSRKGTQKPKKEANGKTVTTKSITKRKTSATKQPKASKTVATKK